MSVKIGEDYLYYLWQFQHFDQHQLCTTRGESLLIRTPGIRNTNAGPDFLHACIVIGNITWYGHVEMHVKASAWYLHQHDQDPAYENVVLHVIWEDDHEIYRSDATHLPTLLLKGRVNKKMLINYFNLKDNSHKIPCGKQLNGVPAIIKQAMLERTLLQRLVNKCAMVCQLLEANQGDWEETTYQLLAKGLGFKINSDAMLALSQRLPLRIIRKHVHHLTQLESLLFGQAGLLESPNNIVKNAQPEPDDYITILKKEYNYLAHKYGLKKMLPIAPSWYFFRTRPANFPTLRIATLAAILHKNDNLFQWLLNVIPITTIAQQLRIPPSPYWRTHYCFHTPSKKAIAGLGMQSANGLLINTIIPLQVTYGKMQDNSMYAEAALDNLQRLPPEHNYITDYWQKLGVAVKTAFDSQSLTELFNHFCSAKKCLSCAIGINLIKGKKENH